MFAQTISIFPNVYKSSVGNSLQIACIGTGISVSDIIWEYYPSSSMDQSPLTTIYIDKGYQSNPNIRFQINNEFNSGTLVSVLTISNVLLSDNNLTFKCELIEATYKKVNQ